jgi:hypothetical protein
LAVAITPSPFGRHAQALTDAAAVFKHAVDAAARTAGCRATVLTESDWIVAHDTVVRPDLVVVCGGVPERHVEAAPAIVVEILSPATRERDLTAKKELYRARALLGTSSSIPTTERSTCSNASPPVRAHGGRGTSPAAVPSRWRSATAAA